MTAAVRKRTKPEKGKLQAKKIPAFLLGFLNTLNLDRGLG
jgi:hypothetical protein